MPIIRSKQWVLLLTGLATVGSLALIASVAHAFKTETIDGQFTTKLFSDTVTEGRSGVQRGSDRGSIDYESVPPSGHRGWAFGCFDRNGSHVFRSRHPDRPEW